MKTYSLLITIAAVFVLTSGCNKQEPVQTPEVGTSQSETPTVAGELDKANTAIQDQATAARQTADQAAADLKDQAADAKAAADKAAADLKEQASAAKDTADQAATDAQAQAATITTKAQSLLDTAGKQIAEKNWSGALETLANVGGLKLTPEQQATFASLKEEAQKLAQGAASSKVEDQAGTAAGDLLK